jgi:hypothetical protein
VPQIMICVVEYGQDIGTLRNLFLDIEQATFFVKRIIEFAEDEYTCIASNKWYCENKNEYLEIKDL